MSHLSPITEASRRTRLSPLLCVALLGLLAAQACKKAPPEPEPAAESASGEGAEDKAEASEDKAGAATKTAKSDEQSADKASGGDPLAGKFSISDAVAALPEKGTLSAELKTSLGTLSCTLFEDKAPTTVANFVGLARGLRPFRAPDGQWVKRPAYDGTTFHRVIKGFMIQGGDPSGTGGGDPGYVIADENWEGATHDRRGLLCMANRGPNTNGMQFFITDAAAKHLDHSYTIFGECKPDSVIEKLAGVEVKGQTPVDPPKIESITISRGKS